jgi:regulator of RNase E activity RraA
MSHSPDDFQALARFDTPTISNALSLISNERQNFTHGQYFSVEPDLPAIVGYARTASTRGVHKSGMTGAQEMEHELAYWEYVAQAPGPTISIIQDLGGSASGYACILGEINVGLHKALGCIGAITDGGIRDVGLLPKDFQLIAASVTPFGSWSHFVDFGQTVTVFGMTVRSDDIVHADRHGAIVIPAERINELIKAAELDMRKERPLIAAGKNPKLTIDELRQAYLESARMK